jgi:hypothetical protein
MQSLLVPTERNPNDHTPDEVRAALIGRSGARRLSFRYELLNMDNGSLGDLDGVQSCTITQNWLADIKRTARFTIRDTGAINYLTDRIRPWVRLHLPPYGPSDWVEWPQGVFLLSSPARRVSTSGLVMRDVQAYDQLKAVADQRVTARYTVLRGQNYLTRIKNLITGVSAGYPVYVTPGTVVTAGDREWEPGTPELRIINDLLDAINYESLSFDEMGAPVLRAYRAPSTRTPEYTYADDQDGVTVPDMQESADLFDIPNQWLLIVSEADRPALSSVYTNTNPASVTSTVRRGRTITAEPEFVEAASQTILDAMAARRAFEASQVFASIEFSTWPMPIHSGNDVYRLRNSPLAINAVYAEHMWEMELRAGARMRHQIRRVVSV